MYNVGEGKTPPNPEKFAPQVVRFWADSESN